MIKYYELIISILYLKALHWPTFLLCFLAYDWSNWSLELVVGDNISALGLWIIWASEVGHCRRESSKVCRQNWLPKVADEVQPSELVTREVAGSDRQRCIVIECFIGVGCQPWSSKLSAKGD